MALGLSLSLSDGWGSRALWYNTAMEREVYEVTIRRVETCRVRVTAASDVEAVVTALEMERRGEIPDYVYSGEHAEATVCG